MAGYSNAGYRVISRANALILPNSYRHAAHVMFHSPCGKDTKLFGYYPVRHAVMVSVDFRRFSSMYLHNTVNTHIIRYTITYK